MNNEFLICELVKIENRINSFLKLKFYAENKFEKQQF
jgi:hypothetical protein